MDAALVSDGQEARYLLVADGTGLFRSADGGTTWQEMSLPIEPGNGVTSISFHAPQGEPPLLLAGLVGGVARSLDLGETWTVHALPAPPPVVTAVSLASSAFGESLAIAGSLEDGVFRSTDAGMSWSAAYVGLLDYAIFAIATVAAAESRDCPIVIGTSSGVFHSMNGGRSWFTTETPAPVSAVLAATTVPCAPGQYRFLAGTEAGDVLRADDPHAQWARAEPGPGLGAVVRLATIGERRPVVVGVFTHGVALSHDCGVTWLPLTDPRLERTDASVVVAATAPSGPDAFHLALGYSDTTWTTIRLGVRT